MQLFGSAIEGGAVFEGKSQAAFLISERNGRTIIGSAESVTDTFGREAVRLDDAAVDRDITAVSLLRFCSDLFKELLFIKENMIFVSRRNRSVL